MGGPQVHAFDHDAPLSPGCASDLTAPTMLGVGHLHTSFLPQMCQSLTPSTQMGLAQKGSVIPGGPRCPLSTAPLETAVHTASKGASQEGRTLRV